MMIKYISLLRGINLGAHKKVNMIELKKMYESLGFENVRTYIQSGNVIFESAEKDENKIIAKIENKIKMHFGFDVSVFIRTKDEFNKIIKNNPFNKMEEGVYVTFISKKVDKFPIEEIEKAKSDSEKFLYLGREIYIYCPDGYGRTKLSNALFERKLKMLGTTRNWRTVTTLLSIANEQD